MTLDATSRLRLATRGSPLALQQTALVAAALRAAHPELDVTEVVVTTRGDTSAESLSVIGGEGIFVREVQAAVLAGQADAAVHSAKDLPSITPDELVIAAMPPRADARDALVGASLSQLASGSTVATGSIRRRAQLANLRPDLRFRDLRGNIATRLDVAGTDDVAAVIVAVAALERLGLSDRIDEIFEPDTMLPQAGQGAIAVECRRSDHLTRERLAVINDDDTHRAVWAERAVLRALGVGCTAPVGAFGRCRDGQVELEGLVASGDGRIVVRATRSGTGPEQIGFELGQYLVQEGGGRTIEGFGTS